MKKKILFIPFLILSSSALVISLVDKINSSSIQKPVEVKAADPVITLSQLANYLSKQEAHYPISDSFIENYQQKSGGYIELAQKLGLEVNAAKHLPDQKWHFFTSWLEQSINQGTATWDKNAKSATYSSFLCPELLLWYFEACHADNDAVLRAKDIGIEARTAGGSLSSFAARMRAEVPWDSIVNNIIGGLSEDDPYHVTPAVGDGYTCTGLNFNGYQPGDTVNFKVTVTDSTKVLDSVSVSGVSLDDLGEGNYSFTMPKALAKVSVALRSKEVPPEPEYNVICDLDFPVEGQGSVSSYAKDWTATNNGYTFTISHANNNSNKWEYIAIGQKGDDSTAYILNNSPISEIVEAIKIHLSAYNYLGVDDATLYIDDNSSFSSPKTIDLYEIIPQSKAPGVVTINIPEEFRGSDLYYKIEFNTNYDLATNGFIHIDEISYLNTTEDNLESLTISGDIPSYIAGNEFAFNRTAVAHYSASGDKNVTSGLTYTLNDEPIKEGDIIGINQVNNNASLVVTYQDAKGNTVSAEPYLVSVLYKEVEGISLNYGEYSLGLNDSVTLLATVEDEYSDHTVTWSSDNPSVADVKDGVVSSKNITGTATIKATAVGGHTASCLITISSEESLDIYNENDEVVTGSTIETNIGSNPITLFAKSLNISSPTYIWSSSNDEVVTISNVDDVAIVNFVGVGTSVISLQAGSLTKNITFVVSNSSVQSLSLTSSVEDGILFNGDTKNSLVLTPSITTTGSATKVINWSISDDEVASISEKTTLEAPITVTGLKEGQTVITATSDFDTTKFVQFIVSVNSDGVTALSWTNRTAINVLAGTKIKDSGDTSKWKFTPTWKSGKKENPSVGVGDNDVHIGLYNTSTPSEENTPLSLDYELQPADNGKYIVAFYKGIRSSSNKQITVTRWRDVYESIDNIPGSYDFSSISKNSTEMDSSVFDTFYGDTDLIIGDSSINKVYADYDSTKAEGRIKLGTGTYAGDITITFDSHIIISNVIVVAKQYNASEKTFSLMGKNFELTDSFTSYSMDSSEFEETNKFSLLTSKSSKRMYIQSITIVASGSQNIGKSEDCLGINEFISNYMHMDDYNESLGYCKDQEHNYYGKVTETGAKYNYNQLNEHQKYLFAHNNAYKDEYARLNAWAKANGEIIDVQNTNAIIQQQSYFISELIDSTNTNIIAILTMSFAAISLVTFVIIKKKTNND